MGKSTRRKDDSGSSSTTRRALATAAGQPYGPAAQGLREAPWPAFSGAPEPGQAGVSGCQLGEGMGVELGSGGVGGLRPAPRCFLISSEPGWSRPVCPRSPERTGI